MDIHCLEIELNNRLSLYIKELKLKNKFLRKSFPNDKDYVNDMHKLNKLIENAGKAIFDLNLFCLGQELAYKLEDWTKEE